MANKRIRILKDNLGIPDMKGDVLGHMEELRGLGHSGSRGDRLSKLEKDMGIPPGGWSSPVGGPGGSSWPSASTHGTGRPDAGSAP